MLKIVCSQAGSLIPHRPDYCHETKSPAPPIEGTLADPAPGDFRERLYEGCIHASLKARPIPILGMDNRLALVIAGQVFDHLP